MKKIMLSKNTPAVDGTGALAYGQSAATYNGFRGIVLNLNKSKPEEVTMPDFMLTEEQRTAFKHCLMIGIYKQLYTNGFLQKNQLKELIAMHTKGGTADEE